MSKLDRSTAPQISDFGRLTLPLPKIIDLDNGIKLYVINSGQVPVNNIYVMWNRGEADVPSPVALNLMTNCLREGAADKDAQTIADIFESNGAWIRFGTSLHDTFISLHALNSNVDLVLPTLIDIIEAPTFDESIFEIKRNKYITDLKIRLEKVLYQATLALINLNYGVDHPFSRDESPEEIAALTRDDLIDAYNQIIKRYPPIVFLSGQIDSALIDKVVAAFSKLTFEQPREPYSYQPRHAAPPMTVSRVPMPGKKQSCVKIAIPVLPDNDREFNLLNTAVIALGGYFGCRLIANIREDKGYTYGTGARLLSFKEGYTVSITCECDNRYVDGVIQEVKNELTRLATEPMSRDELNNVIQYIKSTLASSLDNAFTIADHHITLLKQDKDSSTFYDWQDLLETVTPDDIQQAAARHLSPNNMLIAIAGDS